MYASFLRILRALHLDVFEQPEENGKLLLNNLVDGNAYGKKGACD